MAGRIELYWKEGEGIKHALAANNDEVGDIVKSLLKDDVKLLKNMFQFDPGCEENWWNVVEVDVGALSSYWQPCVESKVKVPEEYLMLRLLLCYG